MRLSPFIHLADLVEADQRHPHAGELGAIFSCRAVDDHPAQLFYKPYQSWTSLVSWPMSLLPGEEVTALALGGGGLPADALAFDDPTAGLGGSGVALVATSRGFVRFISGAGLQKYVWNVGEEVVALAAARDWAIVVHRATGAAAGLEYALIDTDTFEFVQQGKVPLTDGTTLAWIGFTDDNVRVTSFSARKISATDAVRFLLGRSPSCTTRRACSRSSTARVARVRRAGSPRSTPSRSLAARASRSRTGPSASRNSSCMSSFSRCACDLESRRSLTTDEL